MKYAREVIDLMAAFPGRRFSMRQIVRSINPSAGRMERATIRQGALRVVRALAAAKSVAIKNPKQRGAKSSYSWVG